MGSERGADDGPATAEDRLAALESRLAATQTRLAELEDERDIRDLLAKYSFGADLYRGRPWVDLWTDDGVYDLGDQNLPDAYTGTFQGPERLLELITGPNMPPAGRSQHHVHGPLIVEVVGDEATAEGYSVTFVRHGDTTGIWTVGFSRWTFRRVDGRWRIHRRERRELGSPDQTDVIRQPVA